MSYAVHKQTNKLTNRRTNANDYITSTEGGGNKTPGLLSSVQPYVISF